MRQILNHQGMTLVEVLGALAIAGISLTILFHLALSNRVHKSSVDRTIMFKEILTNNVIEAKGALLADLPAPGTCILRTYDLQYKFVSESKITGSPPACNIALPNTTTIQIIWEVEPSTSIEANFSSASLKLPQYSNTLRKVIVYLRGYSNNGADGRLIKNQITLFKR